MCDHTQEIRVNFKLVGWFVLSSSGPGTSRNDTSYKPSFLTDQELKHLVLEVSESLT